MTTVPRWRKSSRSANTSTCVELHHALDAVRDSKQLDGPELATPGLPEFIRQLKAGRFDR
jgi:Domain of unknown function (DUF397)